MNELDKTEQAKQKSSRDEKKKGKKQQQIIVPTGVEEEWRGEHGSLFIWCRVTILYVTEGGGSSPCRGRNTATRHPRYTRTNTRTLQTRRGCDCVSLFQLTDKISNNYNVCLSVQFDLDGTFGHPQGGARRCHRACRSCQRSARRVFKRAPRPWPSRSLRPACRGRRPPPGPGGCSRGGKTRETRRG